jgi:uncharacterized membrane protein
MSENKFLNVRKITISGIVIAVYVTVMFLTQSFAFGQFQVRIATSLYALASMYPFLIVPLGLANFLSNTLMGGLGMLDMVGGSLVGILTSFTCFYLRRFHVYLVGIPILLIPSLLVPLWLSYILKVPYEVLFISVGIGQVFPSIVGVFLVKYLEEPLSKTEGGLLWERKK